MRKLAENILEVQDRVFAQFREYEGSEELLVRMEPKISDNCNRILRNLQ